MPYYNEYHECGGAPVTERRYEPTREEYDERMAELRQGLTARDEVNFFGFIDHQIPFSDELDEDEEIDCEVYDVQEGVVERQELMEALGYGYTGAEF